MMVGDDDVSTLGEGTPGGGRADASARRGRDNHDLALQKPMSGNFFRRNG